MARVAELDQHKVRSQEPRTLPRPPVLMGRDSSTKTTPMLPSQVHEQRVKAELEKLGLEWVPAWGVGMAGGTSPVFVTWSHHEMEPVCLVGCAESSQ